MNGLLASQDVTAVFIVFNNGGGAIFGYLPQARLTDFERYWLTPTNLEISKVADLNGLRHRGVRNIAQFEHALREILDSAESALIEIIIDRAESLRASSDVLGCGSRKLLTQVAEFKITRIVYSLPSSGVLTELRNLSYLVHSALSVDSSSSNRYSGSLLKNNQD